MMERIKDIIKYTNKSNQYSKRELAIITGKRVTKIALIVCLIIGIASLFVQKLPLATFGLLLDILAVLLLSIGAIDDYLDDLHADSLAPDVGDEEHSDKTRYDLIRAIDESVAVLMLVSGFALQIPATF
ncbi:hypothetical protein [Haloarcula sp. CGMCC 1.6347]|uniref:hypothetical protein n=1 Tax=Haloarcula sp. CGMCC 1.6347 TaxID=3111455 RepID=UPI00300F5F7B